MKFSPNNPDCPLCASHTAEYAAWAKKQNWPTNNHHRLIACIEHGQTTSPGQLSTYSEGIEMHDLEGEAIGGFFEIDDIASLRSVLG